MKVCPRCKRNSLNDDEAMNAVSHIGDKIYICSECGKQQGLVGMGICNDIVEIEMEERFKRSIENE